MALHNMPSLVHILFRIASGFILANLTSGIVLTLCLVSPLEIWQKTDQIQNILQLMFVTTVQSVTFSLPFLLVFLTWCEKVHHKNILTYILGGSFVATLTYFWVFEDQSAASTIWEDTSFMSLLLSGVIAGITYWGISGRNAGI